MFIEGDRKNVPDIFDSLLFEVVLIVIAHYRFACHHEDDFVHGLSLLLND